MEKRKRQQSRLNRLINSKEYQFYSPYTLDECVDLLARSKCLPHIVESCDVIMDQIHADHFNFRLRRNVFENLPIEVFGTLTRDGDSTYVTSIGYIGQSVPKSFTLVLVAPIVWLAAALTFREPIMIIGFLIAGFFLSIVAVGRNQLAEIPYQILGKQKEK
jgi:hypothetical protein